MTIKEITDLKKRWQENTKAIKEGIPGLTNMQFDLEKLQATYIFENNSDYYLQDFCEQLKRRSCDYEISGNRVIRI